MSTVSNSLFAIPFGLEINYLQFFITSVTEVNVKTVPQVRKWLQHAPPFAMHHLLITLLFNAI